MSNALAIVEKYLDAVQRIHSTSEAVAETSYYGSLETFLNEIGASLEPSVFCVVNLRNRGAGIPDGGLFTDHQEGASVDMVGFSQKPARGVIEAKPTSHNIQSLARDEQVERYLSEYGQVLITNLYQFMLVTRDSAGHPVYGEVRNLAPDETAFWSGSAVELAKEYGDELYSFLRHVMLSGAPITTPKDVANVLAFYACEALFRIEKGGVDLSVLDAIRRDFENGLGLVFEDERGDHFFRSTLVQTLFYGIFSAWVLWHEQEPPDGEHFDWRTSAYYLHVPVIQGLFERMAIPTHLQRLDLMQVLEWTGAALNRVDRANFFAQFNAGEAVQYFYEPFLEAFDPQLRKDLGVWYTPPEIVEYMVERVDRVLRDELNIPDGLADRNVYVLDPACGTGAYLVAVLRRIYWTLEENYGGAAAADAVREAIRNKIGHDPEGRVFGFEILAASFVVAHLQLGLTLQRLGVPLGSDERAGVYLTNSLTGWLPPEDHYRQLVLSALGKEREEANNIKQGQKILVVIGNPPYNAFAGTTTAEEKISAEEGLVDRYKRGLRERWGIRKYNLDDLYIRFFRIAERLIAELRGEGVVCYISNFSYLNRRSFAVMRERLLEQFDRFWIDNLNGDSRETGKRTPLGAPDPSAFSTDFNRAGIRIGTAICLMVRHAYRVDAEPATVLYREFWGARKREELLSSIYDDVGLPQQKDVFEVAYETSVPSEKNRYSFHPLNVSTLYENWPLVTELSAVKPLNGPIERRGNVLIVLEDEMRVLQTRLTTYLDPTKSNDEVEQIAALLMKSSGEFDAERARKLILQRRVQFNQERIKKYLFKPFDLRYAYLDESIQPLFSRPSPDLLELAKVRENAFFITRDQSDKLDEGIPFIFSSLVCDYHSLAGEARHFPIYVKQNTRSTSAQPTEQLDFLDIVPENMLLRANLSTRVRDYLENIGLENPDVSPEVASMVWLHSTAIGYSTQYHEENEDGILSDWPRIPLPDSAELLRHSAHLGRQIATLLDIEKDVVDVTSGNLREELRLLGRQVGNDLCVSASWGYLQRGTVVMPGLGDARPRTYRDDELAAIAQGAQALGMDLDDALALLGDQTYDLHLNDTTYWANVPANVYEYVIGGYQVIKKWLSYRQCDVLGRSLHAHEVREVTHMIRRIAAIILLQPALNANYREVKAHTYPWKEDTD